MPSPAGHALAGLAAGWLIAGAPRWPPPFWRRDRGTTRAAPATRSASRPGASWIATWPGAALLAALGALPDIDLLFHAHSMYTHSVGAALIVLLAAASLARTDRLVTALACGAAYATHTLLDWLGNDTTPPIGIMALWPFTSGYYESDVHWFMAITRRYWLPNFYTHNLQAVARELGTLVPLTLLIYALKRRRP